MDASHSNLSTVTEFLNTQSAAGDVGKALMDTTILFKVVIWLIMIVGAVAMAIWVGRIAVDILLIVTNGFNAKWLEKMSAWGTGNTKAEGDKAGSYTSVMGYLQNNILEIVLVMILVALLMSGYLLRLIAFGITGVGVLMNKLMGLDIGGVYSSLDASAFTEQVDAQRSTSLRNQYDEQLAAARNYSAQLYDLAKQGAVADDPKFNQIKTYYTQAMVKASILGDTLTSRGEETNMRLGPGYFRQHLRQSGDGVCNQSFIVGDVVETFNVSGKSVSVTCQ